MMMKRDNHHHVHHRNEKLRNIFWMRPAFEKNYCSSSSCLKRLKTWSSLSSTSSSSSSSSSSSPRIKNTTTATSMNTSLVIVFIFFVALMVFAVRLDLGKYSSQVFERALNSFTKTPTTITIEYPLDCNAWNQSSTCPSNYPTRHIVSSSSSSTSSKNATCPEYFRWIYEDLKPWKESGISREMVERAKKSAHFRLIILDGRVYVETYRPSIQTRALFTIWGIVQLTRFYPGKLPDLELMFDCDDRPVVPARDYQPPSSGSGPPPVFRYCSNAASLDIVFPDWSFWGWAEINIKPWRITLKDIEEGNKRSKWKERVPFAYWKGNPHVAPWRADLLKCNVTPDHNWDTLLYIQDWDKESEKGYKDSNLGDQCTHRYKIYIEGWAWSVSEKYILACDSPTLLVTPQFHDFFIRAMVPQKHYWPIKASDNCRSLKFAVQWGNNHTDKAEAIGEAGSKFVHEDMKMEYIYDYIYHLLNEYSKAMRFKPSVPANAKELCAESLACPADGNWRKFMELSLEKSPSSSQPCSLPPPYDSSSLEAFMQDKFRATREVEEWANEYWQNH